MWIIMDGMSSSESECKSLNNKKVVMTKITPRSLDNTVQLIDCIEVGKKISCYLKENCPEISVIAEGSNIGPYGELSFVAIGTGVNVFVLDVLTCPQLMRTTCFKKIFEGKNILKVMYDCKNLCGVLYGRYSNTLLTPVFDIQCAHACIVSQNTHCSPFQVPSLILPMICHKYSENNAYSCYLTLKRAELQKINWWERPFSYFALKAIAAKTLCFFPDVYVNLKMQIHPLNLENFYRICNMNVIYHIFPEIYDRERNEILIKNKCRNSIPPRNASANIRLNCAKSKTEVSGKTNSRDTNEVLEEYESILQSVTDLPSCKRKLVEDSGNVFNNKKVKLSAHENLKPRILTTKQLYKLQSEMMSKWKEEVKIGHIEAKLSTKALAAKNTIEREEKETKIQSKDTREWQTINPNFLDVLLTPSDSNKNSQKSKQSEGCKNCISECDCLKCKRKKK